MIKYIYHKIKEMSFATADTFEEFARAKAKKEKEGYTVLQYHNEHDLAEIIKNRK